MQCHCNFIPGLIDWMRSTMLPHGTISPEDFDFMTLTDDPEEVVDIMVKHREWKVEMINETMSQEICNIMSKDQQKQWLACLERMCKDDK